MGAQSPQFTRRWPTAMLAEAESQVWSQKVVLTKNLKLQSDLDCPEHLKLQGDLDYLKNLPPSSPLELPLFALT